MENNFLPTRKGILHAVMQHRLEDIHVKDAIMYASMSPISDQIIFLTPVDLRLYGIHGVKVKVTLEIINE